MKAVVLIGAARSGTKFLRDLLGTSPQVGVVPYDVNYIWRYRNENYQDDALPVDRADEAVRDYISSSLRRQARRRGSGIILLEKTVSNTLRVPFVNAVLPEARFVHLVRNGRDVVESAYRMWQQRPDWRYLIQKARVFPISNYRYAVWYLSNMLSGTMSGKSGVRVWGPRYPGIESDVKSRELIEVCAAQWAKSVEYATRDLSSIDPGRVLTIHYETLLSDEDKVAEIARFAGITDVDTVMSGYRRMIRRDTGGRWAGLSERDRELALRIMAPQLTALGYPDADDDSQYPSVAR